MGWLVAGLDYSLPTAAAGQPAYAGAGLCPQTPTSRNAALSAVALRVELRAENSAVWRAR